MLVLKALLLLFLAAAGWTTQPPPKHSYTPPPPPPWGPEAPDFATLDWWQWFVFTSQDH